jgi:hypothetical protein
VKTTFSGAWFREHAGGFRAATVGYGTTSAHGERRDGVFAEFTFEKGRHGVSARLEYQDVEAEVLITGEVPVEDHESIDEPAAVTALTLGVARRIVSWKGLEGAIGAQAAFHWTPPVLEPTYGSRPMSFQVYFRLRLPAGHMGRMWNMVMSRGR